MAFVEGVYRVLGVIAPINQRLGRFRVNFIPSNIMLIFAFGTLTVISWNSVVKVIQSRRTPETQTVETLIARTRFARGYVAIQGRLMADSRFSFGDKGAAGNLALADYTWAPLVDAETQRAILVQLPASHPFPGDGADVTIAGMLRPVSGPVALQLKQSKYSHAGIPIDRRFMVVAGRQPGWLEGPLMTGTIFGLLVVAMAWSTLKRNVVFMPSDSGMAGHGQAWLDGASAEPLLVSGTLALDAKTRRFFTNMPAVMQRLPTGDTGLFSHIETSSTYMGLKTSSHSGVWMLAIRPGSVTEAQDGYVFWGLKKMRATRFSYVNAMTGASDRAVVATMPDGIAGAYAATKPTLA